jgi:hypothetical protein
MIISHKYRYIFLKTRKTAGTSLEIALSRFCGDKDIITPISDEDETVRRECGYPGPQNDSVPYSRYSWNDWKRRITRGEKQRYYNHVPASSVSPWIGANIWNSYFKFSFERNPWDKAVSLYYYLVGTTNLKLTFSEYIRQRNDPAVSNYPIYTLNGQVAVDYLGRYENLDEDLATISRTLGFPEKLILPRTKANFRKDKRPYRELYGEDEVRIISELCKKEIDLLHYAF